MLTGRAFSAMQRTATYSALLALMTIVFGLSHPRSVDAQSLASLHIGDPAANLAKLGPAAKTGSYLGMQLQQWRLPNGNELSATTDSTGRIVYLESDWDGKSDDPACDLSGLRFGITTLAELRKRLGSNGFEFQNRAGVIPTGSAVIMVNSYEVGKVIVTFYTKIDSQEYRRLKASDAKTSPADYSKLDGISLADPSYATAAGWGDRSYDPDYKKAEWK